MYVVKLKYLSSYTLFSVFNMNRTESKAYHWLETIGYKPQEITYRARLTPDFITNDGKGFEAKRALSHSIWFYEKQAENLSKMCNVSVVVFEDSSELPIASFPSEQLKKGMVTNNIRVKIVERGAQIKVSDTTHKELIILVGELQRKRGQYVSMDDVILYLLVRVHELEAQLKLKET